MKSAQSSGEDSDQELDRDSEVLSSSDEDYYNESEDCCSDTSDDCDECNSEQFWTEFMFDEGELVEPDGSSKKYKIALQDVFGSLTLARQIIRGGQNIWGAYQLGNGQGEATFETRVIQTACMSRIMGKDLTYEEMQRLCQIVMEHQIKFDQEMKEMIEGYLSRFINLPQGRAVQVLLNMREILHVAMCKDAALSFAAMVAGDVTRNLFRSSLAFMGDDAADAMTEQSMPMANLRARELAAMPLRVQTWVKCSSELSPRALFERIIMRLVTCDPVGQFGDPSHWSLESQTKTDARIKILYDQQRRRRELDVAIGLNKVICEVGIVSSKEMQNHILQTHGLKNVRGNKIGNSAFMPPSQMSSLDGRLVFRAVVHTPSTSESIDAAVRNALKGIVLALMEPNLSAALKSTKCSFHAVTISGVGRIELPIGWRIATALNRSSYIRTHGRVKLIEWTAEMDETLFLLFFEDLARFGHSDLHRLRLTLIPDDIDAGNSIETYCHLKRPEITYSNIGQAVSFSRICTVAPQNLSWKDAGQHFELSTIDDFEDQLRARHIYYNSVKQYVLKKSAENTPLKWGRSAHFKFKGINAADNKVSLRVKSTLRRTKSRKQ